MLSGLKHKIDEKQDPLQLLRQHALAGPGEGNGCLQCNEVQYLNSKPSVGAIIVKNQHVLLVRSSSEHEGWDLPGGFLLFGESPLDGLRRELREELNVGISIERIVDAQVDTYGSRGEYSLNLFYKAHLISGIPQPSGEIREVEWFEIDRLPNLTYKSTQSVLSNLAQASA